MVDHPRRIFKQICICDDILLDCFRLLAPAKVGLALALVSDRFDVLADTHFRSRKWPIGNLGICRGKNGAAIHNQKGGEGRTAAVKRLLPIPQVPLPNGVVGFGRIGLGYIDGTVIAFLRRIRRLFHTNGVTLELSFSSVEGRSCDAFASSIWPLLNAAAIVEMRFKVNNNLGYLRSRLSPSILRDCANLRLISICYGLFPQFPPDDRPGATDGQAVCKWLHTAQADGHPKVLRCALGRAFSMEALKTAFLNATTSVGFILVARWYCRVVPFELENGLTREQLALRNIRHDWWLMERAAIGRNARQWTEWEREALGENGQQGRQSGRNVLVFRAYDDDIGLPSSILRFQGRRMEPSLLRYFCPRQFRRLATTSFCTLSPRHRIIAEGGMPPLEYEFEREKWAMGERFGRYGLRGGVDISKLWPTVEEIEEVKAVRRFRTAKEAQHIAKMESEKEQIRRKNRLDRIERNWATYDAQLAEFNQREVQTEAEKETADQELKRQVEEVRNYFGYWVDPNDPRFSVMLKHREDTLKMEAKMAVKKKKKYGQVTTVSSAERAEMKLVQDEMKKKAKRDREREESGSKTEEEEEEEEEQRREG